MTLNKTSDAIEKIREGVPSRSYGGRLLAGQWIIAVTLLTIALICIVALSGRSQKINSDPQAPSSEEPRVSINSNSQADVPKTNASPSSPGHAGPEEKTAEKKTTIERFADQLNAVRSLIVNVLITALVIAFAVALSWELRRNYIVIDPIVVPKDLAERGWAPDVIAQRIAAELSALQRDARIKAHQEEAFQLSAAQVDFTVPSAGISYRAIVRYVRQLFGKTEQRIQGEIVRELKSLRITLRTREGYETPANLTTTLEHELPDLLKRAAFQIALLVDPYLIATYWLWLEQREGNFQQTFLTVQLCLTVTPPKEHHRAYLIWGIALTNQRKFEEAEEKFRIAQSLEPRFPMTYNSWGNLERARRRIDAAARKYWRVISLDPKYAFAWGNLGNISNDRREYRKALIYFRRAIKLDPRFAGAFTSLGFALWRLNRFEEATKAFARAIDLEPKLGWGYTNWAHMLQRLRQYDEALAKVENAPETFNPAEVLATCGDILVDMERFEEAAEKYRRASEAEPALNRGLSGMGLLLIRQRRFREAVQICEEALHRDRYNTPALTFLCEALFQLGQFEQAIVKYEELLEFDPYQAPALVGWGLILKRLHRLGEAETKLKLAIKIDPTDSWAWRSWGEILREKHCYDQAIEKFRKAVKVNSSEPYSFTAWGIALVALGRHDEALGKFREALIRDDRDQWTRGWIAETLITLGHPDDALAEIEQAALTNPRRAESLVSWGIVLRRLGRNEDAVAKFEEAVSIDEYIANGLVEWANALYLLEKPEALKVVERALAIEPRNTWALAIRGLVLERTNPDEALAWYAKALKVAPEGTIILIEWSNTLFRKALAEEKNEEKAKAYAAESYEKLREATQCDLWNTAPLKVWGSRLLKKVPWKSETEAAREVREAIEKFDQALRLDQYDWRAWAGRGAGFMRLKQYGKATKALRRALTINPNDSNVSELLRKSLTKS